MTALQLGSIVSLQRGNTYKSKLLGRAGPALLGLASIEKDGGFRDGSLKTYGGPTDPRHVLTPGDLFVSLKDVTQSGDLLGSIARVPLHVPRGRLTQDTVKLVFLNEEFDKNFLYWCLRTPEYRSYCRSHALGTTNLSLSRADFLDYELPDATSDRIFIASLLDKIEYKIELNRKTAENIDKIARTIYRSWFIDFDPVWAKVEGSKPVNIDDVEMEHFPGAFGDDGLPDGWQRGTLLDLADLNPQSHSRKHHPDRINYVDLSNTKWGTIEAITPYEWDKAPSRARQVLCIGDTIVGTVRPGNGSYALIGQDGLTGSTGFAVLRPRCREDAAILYLAATDPATISELANLADGGAYPAVRPEIVAHQALILSSPEVRRSFSRRTTPLINGIEALKGENKALTGLRDALLQQLVSGELRVCDAAREVEPVA